MNYFEEAKALVQNLAQRMGPSPYDIAWMARLRLDGTPAPRWPDLIEWLLEHQYPDGSWGGEIPYYHDRIICTLTSAIALRENGHRPEELEAIRRAERYLWTHLHLLQRDHFELVGFELIFPTLIELARTAGLDVPRHTYGYGRIQTAKLKLVPPGLLYSPNLSTVHSLEFLGNASETERLRAAVGGNGSLGNSPATTAYYAMRAPDDDRPARYFEAVRGHMPHVIYLYPCRIFELTWALNNLAFSGRPVTDFAPPAVWRELQEGLSENGIGLDASFGIPDGDITSVTSRLLAKAGFEVDPRVLGQFENPETHLFRTYHYERNLSVGTNVHALEALAVLPGYAHRRETQENIVVALLGERKYDLYWIDKWHISPYYGTAHVLVALMQTGFGVETCRHTVDWLIHTQRPDGSWGFFDRGTAEETAYVLTTLLYYQRQAAVNPDVLHRGAAFLQRTHHGPASWYPELWIGKCLYTPIDVVRAAILAALILYEDTFGRLPD